MDDLIEALAILRKYNNSRFPTACEHDIMYFVNIDYNDVSEDDVNRLDELGIFWGEEEEVFMSFRFGNA